MFKGNGSSLNLPEVGMACLLGVLNCIDLTNQALRALIANQRKYGRIDILVLAFADLGKLQHPLIGLLVCRSKSSNRWLALALLNAQVVVSAVKENIYPLL